ncbi:MAG: hypothetical protein C4B59_14320 [Candidatus Methanogaster sp.]|uniref:Uncharacterized protein n=1 Tax=Candidatus Methanogaster sp. TaxID=3386292 RepID=A0AC61KZH4_9EURY|nr:MAG: hypothetical protein C4B59_14320 [ANME-2 cluster archaeon]
MIYDVDANGDGIMNSLDAFMILQASAGAITLVRTDDPSKNLEMAFGGRMPSIFYGTRSLSNSGTSTRASWIPPPDSAHA